MSDEAPRTCPYSVKSSWRPPQDRTFACCRYYDGVWLPGGEEPLCRTMSMGADAYRFTV